jgi:hypothetical protein
MSVIKKPANYIMEAWNHFSELVGFKANDVEKGQSFGDIITAPPSSSDQYFQIPTEHAISEHISTPKEYFEATPPRLHWRPKVKLPPNSANLHPIQNPQIRTNAAERVRTEPTKESQVAHSKAKTLITKVEYPAPAPTLDV